MGFRKFFQLSAVFFFALLWFSSVIAVGNAAPVKNVSAQSGMFPVFTVTKTTDPTSPLPGDIVTYTIAIATDAQTTLTNVTIYDEVPANTTYVSGSAVILQPQGTVVLPTSGTVGDPPNLVTAMTVTNNSTASVQFQVQINQPLVSGTLITNTAFVTSTEVPTSTTASVVISVQNAPPIANNETNSTPEDTSVNGILSATDALNGDALAFSIVSTPSHGTVQITNVSNGDYIFTPTLNFFGDDTFTFKANDGISDSNIATITVTVNAVNDPPVLDSIGSQNVDEETLLTFTATASDVDLPADTLTFSMVNTPTGATIDETSGIFSWTPIEAQGAGTFAPTIIVSDGTLTDSETITIIVNEVNQAPVLDSIGSQNVDEETSLTFTATASDVDLPANTLTFSMVNAPTGATIGETSGIFSWTPTEAQGAGTFALTIVVSDGTLTDSETITIIVNEVNRSPVLDPISEKTVDEGQTLTFTATASDADLPANSLTFSLSGALTGMTINPTTGVFSWTPHGGHGPGIYHPIVIVSDGITNDSQTVTINVIEVADITLTKTGTVIANAGEPISHTLTIQNLGPSEARNITLTDALPSGITFALPVEISPVGGSCNLTTAQLICNFSTLEAGTTKSVILNGTLNADTTINQTNVATVTTDTIDRETNNNTDSFTTIVTTQADLALSKIVSSDTVFVGDVVTFTLTLTNTGPSNATDVVLTDNLPASLDFESVSAGCTENGGVITCNFATLAVNDVENITIRAMPNTHGAIINTASAVSTVSDSNLTNNSDTAIITAVANADVAISKIATPNLTEAGRPLTFTLTITNFGPSTAHNVVVEDMLPADVTFTDKHTTQGTCYGNADIVCVIGTLNPTDTARIDIVVTPNNLGTLNNTATVTTTTVDRETNNNSASVLVNVTTRADTAISMQGIPQTVVAGETLTYTMSITNLGPSIAHDVTLTDNLPTGLSFQSGSVGCSTIGQSVTCDIGDLNANSSTIAFIVAKVSASVQNTIVNTATVSAFEFDPDSVNNSATVSTAIEIESDLFLSKSVNTTTVTAGLPLTYTLSIINLGVSDAQNIVLTDTLPAGVSVNTMPTNCTQNGDSVICNWGSLATNNSKTVILPVLVSPATRGTLDNSAVVTTTSPDINVANNTDSVSVSVTAEANLSLNLTDTPDPLYLDEPITLAFTVTNAGLSEATGVTLTATLPVDFFIDSILAGQGSCVGSQILTCTMGSLAPQSAATITVIGTVTGTKTTIVETSARVTGIENDPNLDDNSQTIESTFEQSTYAVFLPLTLKQNPPPPMTKLSVWNDNTGGNVTFSVLGTGVSCTVGNNDTQLCGTFSPGTYQVQVISSCGNGIFEKTYIAGEETTRVFCN